MTASRRARLVRVAVSGRQPSRAGGGVGRVPERAVAGRHETQGQGTGVEPARRAADVQPLRGARLGAGGLHPPHAGPPRADRPADAGAPAVAGGIVDRVGRRPHLHAETAPRRHLLRRRAVHVRRRPVRVQGDLRREDAADPRRVDAGRREAARGERARRVDGGRAVPVGIRAGHPAARQPRDPAAPQAGAGAERGHAGHGMGPVDAAVRNRRPRAVRAEDVPGRAAARLRAQPALLEEGRARPAAPGARPAHARDRPRPERRDPGAADRARSTSRRPRCARTTTRCSSARRTRRSWPFSTSASASTPTRSG